MGIWVYFYSKSTDQFYDRAIAIRKPIYEKDRDNIIIADGLANNYGNMGYFYYQEGDKEKALHFVDEAIKVSEGAGVKKTVGTFKNFRSRITGETEKNTEGPEISGKTLMGMVLGMMEEGKDFSDIMELVEKSIMYLLDKGEIVETVNFLNLWNDLLEKTGAPEKLKEHFKNILDKLRPSGELNR